MITEESHKVLHLKFTMDGHTGEVYAVRFSPDGESLFSAGLDSKIRRWSLLNGEQESTLEGHYRSINCLAFSPDGKILAGAGFDSQIRLWSLDEGKIKWVLKGHDEAVTSIAFSPDGSKLVSGGIDMTVRLWDVNSGTLIHTFEGYKTSKVTSILNKLRKVDEDSFGHCGAITSVDFSKDGEFVASGSLDETVKLWSLESKNLVFTMRGHNHPVHTVQFSPDGKYLTSGCCDDPLKLKAQKGVPSNDKTINMWSTSSGVRMKSLKAKSYDVRTLSYSPDGSTIATGGWDYTNNHTTIRLWDVETCHLIRPLEGHFATVYSVAFSPDERRLASSGDDKSVKLWTIQQ